MHDVIIVGGSYAGMAAALQLLRARRDVKVIDAGERRNRFAGFSHGFLGQDGVGAAEIALSARRQLEAYPTLSWVDGRAVSVEGSKDDFTVATADGRRHGSRRVLFATGLEDQLPEISGLAERWGHAVFHCPYCHGYELDQGKIGVIATGPMSTHQAEIVSEWGPVTFLTNGAVELDPPARQVLEGRSVSIETTLIERIDGVAEVVLKGGRRLGFAGLFTAPFCVPSSSLAEEAGCDLEETMMGIQIRTNEAKQTSVAGISACGDVARIPHSVTLAVADGAWAGAQIHRSLVWPDG
ncbi:MAG: NAD(P)/FAD-dependent oxidoreductase [Hoeflea sp.]|uniref:NAD(P)/FAD-dependent oxidoreductase n=1 Tax=Hoeflea sp. TaxID=1940281 RepID=UPI0032EE898C